MSNVTVPANNYSTNYNIFASDEKKLQFKAALKKEDRLVRLKEVVDFSPKLELKVLSSAFLEKGEVLVIKALGLENMKSKER